MKKKTNHAVAGVIAPPPKPTALGVALIAAGIALLVGGALWLFEWVWL
ncbi:MAG: hypothetical protein P8P56_14405 [Yoonia sp.]|nr:hypothetical protein [Yoonia sp.]MDG1862142.1 hypothetical protein [Yoonia sp.]